MLGGRIPAVALQRLISKQQRCAPGGCRAALPCCHRGLCSAVPCAELHALRQPAFPSQCAYYMVARCLRLCTNRATCADMTGVCMYAHAGEKCDPYVYYHRVRQPMSGWRSNPRLPHGLIYEGVSDTPLQVPRGQERGRGRGQRQQGAPACVCAGGWGACSDGALQAARDHTYSVHCTALCACAAAVRPLPAAVRRDGRAV